MAPQHDYVIANGSGSAVRSDLNNALAAIVSLNSGASEPTDTFAYMWWADTTAGVLKIRNAANNAWITLRELDGTLLIEAGSASTPGLYFAGDTNTGIYSPGADQFAIASNGVERVEWGTSGVVFNDGGADYDFRVEGDTNANLFFTDASTDRIGFGTNAPITGVHIAIPAASATSGNVHLQPAGGGQARYRLFNGGGVAEWLFGQKTNTDHSFKISKSVATIESDYLELTTTGLLKVPNGIEGCITDATAVASTSGVAVEFLSIPSWVKRITMMLDSVSTDGTNNLAVQIGDSGGFEATGYTTGLAYTGGSTGSATSSTSFPLAAVAAGDDCSGHIVITNISGNKWVASSVVMRQNDDIGFIGGGVKELSATLDRVRITAGGDTFDAGSVNIFMEG